MAHTATKTRRPVANAPYLAAPTCPLPLAMSLPPTPLHGALPAPDASPERARIVAAALDMYLHQGMAAVEAADVARYLRLAEERVHYWFADKATLVAASIETHALRVYNEACQHKEQSNSAVEELLLLRNWASGEMHPRLGLFFQELATDYPASHERWQQHMQGFPVELLRTNLHWGVQQGFYHPTLEVEQAVTRWFENTHIMRAAAATEQADMHRTLLEQFIASIVTPAGALVVRRLQEAYPFY